MIPKIIHQIWVGGDRLPQKYLAYRHTWIDHHPDWSFMIWNDDAVKGWNFLSGQSYNLSWCNAMKADVLRFEVLHRYGGVYIDTDMECVKPIDPLLIGDFMISELSGMLAHAFMGSTPQHPLVEQILLDLPRRINNRGNIHETTGLQMFAEHAANFGLDNLVVHPDRYFYHTPFIYARHDYGASWKGNEFSQDPELKLL